jgi:hypothetical protein
MRLAGIASKGGWLAVLIALVFANVSPLLVRAPSCSVNPRHVQFKLIVMWSVGIGERTNLKRNSGFSNGALKKDEC